MRRLREHKWGARQRREEEEKVCMERGRMKKQRGGERWK